MQVQKLYGLTAILFATFLTLGLYQNCSKPINDVGLGGVDANSCKDGGICSPQIKVGNSPFADQMELDMNQEQYFTFIDIPGASDDFMRACADSLANGDCIFDPDLDNNLAEKAAYSFDSSTNTATFVTNIYRRFFGIPFIIQAGSLEKFASKVFFVKPPHQSSNVEDAHVWYSQENNLSGEQRLWTQGSLEVLYLNSNTSYVSNVYIPNNLGDVKICIITYQRSSNNAGSIKTNSPNISDCDSWDSLSSGDLSVDNGSNYTRYYKQTNLSDLNLGNNNTMVTYIKKTSNNQVINSATTWIAID